MNPTPTTRPRHALRWVLGVGLVFVVVSAMALQTAQRRADERWDTVMAGWDQASPLGNIVEPGTRTRGGSVFREWRQGHWGGPSNNFVVRQERILFGSSIEARATSGVHSELIEAVRGVLDAVEVKLVVEP